MSFSKQLFPLLLLLLFLFPFRYASNPKKCSTSFSKPLTCGSLEVPIRFPFCDHPGFNLYCNDHNKTVLELPFSGTFLVEDIDYIKQYVYINNPDNCLAKRILNLNLSGSPFSPRYLIYYTFFTCPNEVVLPYSYRSIPCLNNSTSSFYATTNFSYVEFLKYPSCQVVKSLFVPDSSLIGEIDFSGDYHNQTLLLEWRSPHCTICETINLRCGFANKTSVDVKCFGAKKSVHLSRGVLALIISVFLIGVVTATCIAIRIYNSERFVTARRRNAAMVVRPITQQLPRDIMVTRGLDQRTIDSYKKVELGESRIPPGTNCILCPICLSEYASKETVRFIPDCDHCFHVECIDMWLKLHGSCPVCRKSHV